jgi:quercetin dioxygenase-like cupin family protein
VKQLSAVGAAATAVAPNPSRPATAMVFDAPDARLVVFRLAPGQSVPPHRNSSTVILTVLSGSGIVSGPGAPGDEEHPCRTGDVIVYAPDELHGMAARETELVILATITPRPGSR